MSFEKSLIRKAIEMKKFDAITDICNVIHSDKEKLIVTEYAGSVPRVFVDNNKPTLMVPKNMTVIQEGAVTSAIEKGTIFDDATNIENNAEYIEKTCLPCNAMCNKGVKPPKRLKFVLTGIIGVLDEDGHCDVDEPELRNGYNYIRDLTKADINDGKLVNMTTKYLQNNYSDDEEEDIDASLRKEIASIADDMKDIDGINEDDEITDSDFEELDVKDDNVDTDYQEGFLTKRPKKLKPLPRNIISYITVELNAIQDSNDQAMLSGYTCSKLELVDFYLNCIDTQDERYIVPHTRQYLVNMQNELNNLLTRILKIKPVNRNDRVWQVNVNYPEGWRG